MTSRARTLKPSDTVLTAIRLVVSSGMRHFAVLEQGELVGVVSDADLLLAVARKDIRRLTVGDVMTGNVHTTTPGEPLASLATRLADERVGCLPIVRDGRFVGMVTVVDVLTAVVSANATTSRATAKKKATKKKKSRR